jgi:hypothetical protein
MDKTTLIASAISLAALSGCALTPNEVLETDALARTTLKVSIATLAPCLLNGMDNISGTWNTSQRMDADGASFRLHGHSDIGTVAVVRARQIGGQTEIGVHIASIFPKQPLADAIKAIAEGCDTR